MITMLLRPRYWIDTAVRISQMKLVFSIAAIAHLLFVSQFSDAYAADPYDGEWTGSAKGTSDGRCKPADVTLTVHGKVVTGQAKFEADIANIYGTVREDGTFGATIGFRPLERESLSKTRPKGAFRMLAVHGIFF